MGQEESLRLFDPAVQTLQHLCGITGRKDIAEVVIDALRTYEWILYEQSRGHKIVSTNSKPEETAELASFVRDQTAAKDYFGRR